MGLNASVLQAWLDEHLFHRSWSIRGVGQYSDTLEARPKHQTLSQYRPIQAGSRRTGMKIAHMRTWPMVALRWSPMSTLTISVHFNIYIYLSDVSLETVAIALALAWSILDQYLSEGRSTIHDSTRGTELAFLRGIMSTNDYIPPIRPNRMSIWIPREWFSHI